MLMTADLDVQTPARHSREQQAKVSICEGGCAAAHLEFRMRVCKSTGCDPMIFAAINCHMQSCRNRENDCLRIGEGDLVLSNTIRMTRQKNLLREDDDHTLNDMIRVHRNKATAQIRTAHL